MRPAGYPSRSRRLRRRERARDELSFRGCRRRRREPLNGADTAPLLSRLRYRLPPWLAENGEVNSPVNR